MDSIALKIQFYFFPLPLFMLLRFIQVTVRTSRLLPLTATFTTFIIPQPGGPDCF